MSYQPQNFREQAPWHRDLGHLERDVAPAADDPGPIFTSFSRNEVSDQCLTAGVPMPTLSMIAALRRVRAREDGLYPKLVQG